MTRIEKLIKNDIEKLKAAWESLPEGTEKYIGLYHDDGRAIASVYKSKRAFEEVFRLGEPSRHVRIISWHPTPEVVIDFTYWKVLSPKRYVEEGK